MEKKIFAYQFVVNDEECADDFWKNSGGKLWTIAAQTALRILGLKPNFTDYVGSPDGFYLPAEIGKGFAELIKDAPGNVEPFTHYAVCVYECSEDYERDEYELWKSHAPERYERADD